MATRNSERFLPDALASVARSLGDTGAGAEILVSDGRSDDATVAIASAWPGVRIVSREDSGIYDAMNRAIAAASGTYCLILNSDDLLLDGALGRAIALLNAHPSADFASAPALFGTGIADATARGHYGPLSAEGAMFGIPAINARLFRRAFLQATGPIRTDLGLAADREFLVRIALAGAGGVAIDEPLYLYRVHAGSQTISSDRAGYARVYGAEAMLAERLAGHPDRDVAALARAAAAIAWVKRRLRRIGTDEPAAAAWPALRDVWSGLLLARRWRGRLSGY